MNISCRHCGERFSITADQLGTRGKCPHCRATVVLPRARTAFTDELVTLEPPTHWTESLLCGIGAVAIHLAILVLIAMIPWGKFNEGTMGDAESVFIGELPQVRLVDQVENEFEPVEFDVDSTESAADLTDPLQQSPLNSESADVAADALAAMSPSAASGTPQDIANLSTSEALSGGQEDFDRLIQRLNRDGLDIVITFDSTGSMQGEIDQVKSRIERIGSVLFRLVPRTRLSICTYRDEGDEYVVRGLPLTDNLTEVVMFLNGIQASGGGDEPEAVDRGLEWSIRENRFRRRARKVILLFGDAPPHPSRVLACQKLVSEFRKQGGVVSTVTCRRAERLEEFVSLAQLARGEAYLTQDERQIVSQLVILVFGSQHRDKVIEAFDLMREIRNSNSTDEE